MAEKKRTALQRPKGLTFEPNRGKYSKPPYSRAREAARRRRQVERGIIRAS